jgi:spermidine synthase
LDGVIQLTERDADSYNEMMAHMAMMQHKRPKRALVIGGGDGYVLSEVLKHDSIEHVDHVDLDENVIEACKNNFFHGRKSAWDDPRVQLHIADGAAFVDSAANSSYDVVIQDSSDPWTTDEHGNRIVLPSSLLYTQEHFQAIVRILTPAGIFNFQAETFNIPSDVEGIREWRKQALQVGFQRARYGSLYISSYPMGQIGFILCKKGPLEGTSHDDVVGRSMHFMIKLATINPS